MMHLYFVVKNIKDMLRHHRGLLIILILSQIVSSFTILFSYGVYENYQKLLIEDAYAAKCISISFNENTAAKDINGLFVQLINKFDGKMKDVAVHFEIEELDGSLANMAAVAFVGYDKGKFILGDSLVNEIEKRIIQGGMFSKKDVEDGNQVAITNFMKLGETIPINGEDFHIVGVDGLNPDKFGCYIFIPYTSIYDKEVQVYLLELSFQHYPTRKDYNTFVELCNEFSNDVDVSDFYISDSDYRKELYSIYCILGIMTMAVAFNLNIIFTYILKNRTKKLAIYRIYGCTKKMAASIFVVEVISQVVSCYIIGLLLFRFLAFPYLRDHIFTMFDEVYSPTVYGGISIIYLGVLFLVSLIFVWIQTKLSANELKRRTGL